MSYTGRDVLLGGLFVALAITLPILFHAIGLGSAFLPMFFPIILAGFLTELPVALCVGILSPITSSLLTGMPPLFPPVALIMMAEGFVLAGITSLLYRKLHLGLWPTLILAVFVERSVLLVAVILASKWLDLPEGVLGIASLIRSLPGIVLIFVIIPPLVVSLEKKMNHLSI